MADAAADGVIGIDIRIKLDVERITRMSPDQIDRLMQGIAAIVAVDKETNHNSGSAAGGGEAMKRGQTEHIGDGPICTSTATASSHWPTNRIRCLDNAFSRSHQIGMGNTPGGKHDRRLVEIVRMYSDDGRLLDQHAIAWNPEAKEAAAKPAEPIELAQIREQLKDQMAKGE